MDLAEIGKMPVFVFCGIALVLGILKCYQVAKRDTTSSKCVYGLMITLVGILMAYLILLFKEFKLASFALFFLLGILWLILLISSFILSIIGLVEYKQHPGYTRGPPGNSNKDLNFRYKVPPHPWVELDAKKINSDAVFGLLNSRLKIVFMIIAEKGGLDLQINSASLAEISRGNLKSIAPNVTFSEEKPYIVNGLQGLRFFANEKKRCQARNYP